MIMRNCKEIKKNYSLHHVETEMTGILRNYVSRKSTTMITGLPLTSSDPGEMPESPGSALFAEINKGYLLFC